VRRSSPALLALGLAAAPMPALAETALDGRSIYRIVAGKSASFVRSDGRAGSVTYLNGGKLVSQVQVFGRPFNVEGTWRVRGDRFCRTVRLDSPPTRCQRVVRLQGRTYRFINEDGSSTTTTFR
jgi:hypothetical protein